MFRNKVQYVLVLYFERFLLSVIEEHKKYSDTFKTKEEHLESEKPAEALIGVHSAVRWSKVQRAKLQPGIF
jgi:hypothetical protein